MDLRKLQQMHIDNGKELNIDLNNSGSDTRLDTRAVPDFAVQKKRGKTQFNTPIQPVFKTDPRYNEDKKPYNNRFSKSGYNIG